MHTGICKILVAASGNAAASRIPSLIKTILKQPPIGKHCSYEVELIVTTGAKQYIKIDELPERVKVYDDKLAWDVWQQKGSPVLHTDLPKLSDMFLIAPLSANTMAMMVHGLCDNMLTATIRSWDFEKPLLFCPSMTPTMWSHPVTAQHLATLKQWGCIEIPPVNHTLENGGTGIGEMADIHAIVDTVVAITKRDIIHPFADIIQK